MMTSHHDVLQRVLRLYLNGHINHHAFLKNFHGIYRQIAKTNGGAFYATIVNTFKNTKSSSIIENTTAVDPKASYNSFNVDIIILKKFLDVIRVAQSRPVYHKCVYTLLSASRTVGYRLGTQFKSIHDEVMLHEIMHGAIIRFSTYLLTCHCMTATDRESIEELVDRYT